MGVQGQVQDLPIKVDGVEGVCKGLAVAAALGLRARRGKTHGLLRLRRVCMDTA